MLSKASKIDSPRWAFRKQNRTDHDYGRINHGKEDIGKYFSQNNYRGLKGRRAILPWYPFFSRVMDIEVIIADTNIKMTVITPGTKVKHF
jgi:hypothetical protein